MGQVEAAGEVVTGTLLGHMVEPDTASTGDHGALCANCGTALAGAFCHSCGQAAHIHHSLHSILHDLLHGVFHFEGKIWHTLPKLTIDPGGLTRRYIDGERARFVSPLALFLFSVFLLFAAFSWSAGAPEEEAKDGRAREAAAAQLPSVEKRIADVERRIAAGSGDVSGLRIERVALRAQQRALRASERSGESGPLNQIAASIRDGLLGNDKDSYQVPLIRTRAPIGGVRWT